MVYAFNVIKCTSLWIKANLTNSRSAIDVTLRKRGKITTIINIILYLIHCVNNN